MPPPLSKTERNLSSEPGRPGPGAPRVALQLRAAALAACAAATALIWLNLLPQIGQLPTVRTMIDRNDALGVDPSAKFYSELPAMPRLVEQVQDARRRSASETR